MTRHRLNSPCLLISAILLLSSAYPAAASYVGGQPPKPGCACACSCSVPSVSERSNTSSSVSRTEGNLMETVPITMLRSAFGPTVDLSFVYNSYNADNSQNTLDTVAGYGWTHSYNIFLFSQLGSMFRYDGDGRVTRYAIGPNGTYTAATGYFETLVKTGATTFVITKKDQTVYTFTYVAGTPFVVGGLVYRLTQIVDRNGNTITLTYTSGNLIQITDTYGRSVSFTYNAANKIASVKDPLGRATTFQYDSTNRKLTQVTDPNGNSIHYNYNTLYQLSNKTDKAGRTFTYTYGSGLKPMAVNDANNTSPGRLSNPNNWAIDPTQLARNQLRVYLPSTATTTDGRGNAWQYQYDPNGYILQQKDPDGSTTTYAYDPSTLQLASMTDANSHTTSYLYNSEGDLLQVTDALGNITTYTYEPTFNMMTSMTR
jgi:YD repeat-containing protein